MNQVLGPCPTKIHRTDLLQHPKNVNLVPELGYLAAFHANDVDAANGHFPFRRGDTHQLTLVCAHARPPGRDLVARGEHVLDGCSQIGKRRAALSLHP
jgi:hypothetical protein